MHLVYPAKFCRAIVFDFSWDDCYTQEKLETTVMQNLGEVNEMHYGPCENGELNFFSSSTLPSQSTAYTPLPCQNNNNNNNIKNGKQSQRRGTYEAKLFKRTVPLKSMLFKIIWDRMYCIHHRILSYVRLDMIWCEKKIYRHTHPNRCIN